MSGTNDYEDLSSTQSHFANLRNGSRKRKSRWDNSSIVEQPCTSTAIAPPALISLSGLTETKSIIANKSSVSCHDTDSFDESQVYKAIAAIRQMQAKEKKNLIVSGKLKPSYEYDSDEDVEDGTWEHKKRRLEMETTAAKADQVTNALDPKHHIGDFIPSKMLQPFLSVPNSKSSETAAAAAIVVDSASTYEEQKLTDNNLGYKMLQKMGWTGKGLGRDEVGITAPINQGKNTSDKHGLGASSSSLPSEDDDAFEQYRKRMMFAYRFRPNPLNNPRRPYY